MICRVAAQVLRHRVTMIRSLMQKLMDLQTLELQVGRGKRERDTEIKELRAAVPAPILGHFDRLVARGKKAVSVVRNGTCTACHIRAPIGVVAALAHGNDVQLCGNCGRYLHLPEEELAIMTSQNAPQGKEGGKGQEEAAVHVK